MRELRLTVAAAAAVLSWTMPLAHGATAVVVPSGAPAVRTAPKYLAPGATWTGQLVADIHDYANGSATRYFLHRRDTDIALSVPGGLQLQQWVGKSVTLQGFGTDSRIDVVDVAPAPAPAAIAAAAEAPLECTTVGEQKAAVILMNQPSALFQLDTFPVAFWRNAFFGASPPSVNSFLVETSSGRASLSGDVFGPFEFDRDYDNTETDQAVRAAIAAARAAGVDVSPYTRFAAIFTSVGSYSGALAGYGCSAPDEAVPNEYSRMVVFLQPNAQPAGSHYTGIVAHELGHNLELTHANSADFGSIPLGALDYDARNWNEGFEGIPGSWALVQEYGDPFSVMGTARLRPFAARDELAMGWLPQAAHREVMGSGDFLLEPLELDAGVRTIRVLREPSNSSWLWLEYRQPIGFYGSNLEGLSTTNIFEGAYVRYEDAAPLTSRGVTAPLKALHFNPQEAPNYYELGTLTAGQSWSDAHSPLRLEVNRGDAAGLSVSAHFEEPCAALAASQVGADVVIDVASPETCEWQASAVAGWLTLVSAGDGRGNGTVRYRAEANTGEQQRRAYITVARQSIPVVQKGTGIFIHPLETAHVVGQDHALQVVVDFPGGAEFAAVDAQMGFCGVRAEYHPTEGPRVILVDTQQKLTPGSAESASDAHCTLRGAGSVVEFSGTQLRAVFDLSLHATYGSFPIRLEAVSWTGLAEPLVAGTWTVELPTHPLPPPPGTPTGLVATAASGQVELSWGAAEHAASYRVYRSTQPGAEPVEAKAAIGDTHAVVAGLTNGTTYRFTVKAVNSAGLSAASNEVSATPVGPGGGGGGGSIDPRVLLLLALLRLRRRARTSLS
jgi:M6 family metalloprotease-like protein